MAKSKRLASTINELKVAIYIRVSTRWQVDKDSLPLQRDELPKYAELVLGIKKYEIFEDAGYSAKNTDRPAYQQMMARVRSGEFSHILVWKIDRISRNLLDFAAMYQELKDYGVTFVSKNEQFDTSTAIGEAMLKIILVFAELERNMTSERVSAVMLSRAEQGLWNGGRIPYGYRWDKELKTFFIVKGEAAVVKKIYELYRTTKSSLQVAKTLNEQGLLPRSGNPWTPVTIGIILKNPFYCGKLRYNYRDEKKGLKHWSVKDEAEWIMIDEHHPAIVDEEDWRGACKQLESQRRNQAGPNRAYTRKNTHIFAGLLTCGYCGGNMGATIDRARADGWRPSIYNCYRHRRFNDCKNKYVSDVTLGPFVLNYISNLIKARKSFGKTTSIETFQKKLLRGPIFADVERIEQAGLEEMYQLIKSGRTEVSFVGPEGDSSHTQNSSAEERALLLSERRRKERALKRLTAAYLYDDTAIPEKDFIIERKRLSDSLAELDARIAELDKSISNSFDLSDDEFISKASYFIVSQRLTDRRFVNYEAFIKAADPKIVRDFVTSVIQNFCILDGKIQTITFKNGIEHKFIYKQSEAEKSPEAL
jgi:DNA invertase Pin-like site-specific DNA recombinase